MSAGRVVPGVHIRIVDEQDRDLPVGETGEVLIQSPTVFTGYWRRPDLTSATLRKGYLVTGDMGKLSRDGYLTLLGRKTDRVRRGDITLDPRPLEEAVHDHPAVKEASLVQVGEQILLAISLRCSYRAQNNSKTPNWADILQRHLQERLPDTQIPDHVVIFPQDLPRSTLGKVLRRDVLEQKRQEQAS